MAQTNTTTLISPEVLVPRLGEQLVEMGLLTDAQLQTALEYQRQGTSTGKNRLLGQSLVDLGYLDRPTLDQAITEQIMHLRAALEDANRNLEARVQQRTIELQEALRRLSEMNQLKANLVANVSHELRTPLTHISGYLDLLATESLGDLNSDQKKAVEVSLRSAARLQGLIDDLILFSQASKGAMTLNIAPVDVTKLVANLIARIQPRAEDRHLTLDVELDPNLPHVLADAEKLSWALDQLMDNAVKFTQPGGRILLSISRPRSVENIVNFRITDTGIGILPEHITEIFEPFHQLDGSPTRRYGGTGLGLALVLQIIEAHGSLLDVKSEIDKGTTFSFPLLVAKAK